MTLLSDIFDMEQLQNEIEGGYVRLNTHPTLPLNILTYTRPCQYEGRWNEVTTACRGLIFETGTSEVVAHPFHKFFNYGEHGERDYAPELPTENFDVYEKLDGSLGVVFNYKGKWMVASKGSFTSDQAVWANAYIERNERFLSMLRTELTYCAEIIYPGNRIVVDYGDLKDLVFIGAFHANGLEVDFELESKYWKLGSVARRFGCEMTPESISDVLLACAVGEDLDGMDAGGTDAEGFVLRFESGVRVKAKFAEYVRLHKIMTGVTERDIWRAAGHDLLYQTGMDKRTEVASALKCQPDELVSYAELIAGCPDEMDAWASGVQSSLYSAYRDKLTEMCEAWDEVERSSYAVADDYTRGDFARVLLRKYGHDKVITSAVFAGLDGKPVAPIIWKSLYPAAAKPFKDNDDV